MSRRGWRVVSTLIVIAGLCVAGQVRAGYRGDWNVSVGSTYATGSMGTARASADGTQWIGCEMRFGTGGVGYAALCYAQDSAGNYRFCGFDNTNATTMQQVSAVIASITPASYIYFTFNASGGTCNFIQVEDKSYFRPMVP